MDFTKVLSNEEVVALTLRSLYAGYGYQQYKMSKFEEYDLYVRNKDFLISDSVITFTDTDGRLMALKPDVTLSIIKNGKDGDGLMKVYYNENVYRVSKGTRSFKEIMQVGVECQGEVNQEAVTEVMELALKSLEVIGANNALAISHLDIIKGVLDEFGIKGGSAKELTGYLGAKNRGGILKVCEESSLSAKQTEVILNLVNVCGAPSVVLTELDSFKINQTTEVAVEELKEVVKKLEAKGYGDRLVIDFSVINTLKYYNGMAFNGFVEGIPQSVLSGGEYDNLMKKMGRKSKAIGFAVYLDELFKLGTKEA
ncbi:MAG: ATP phosphoribosyltransferase regulatory subunit [Clostridia bacterium]|nr:ATP phosphoribosyltransferase regulatory subunit [Clostridia bacterium]